MVRLVTNAPSHLQGAILALSPVLSTLTPPMLKKVSVREGWRQHIIMSAAVHTPNQIRLSTPVAIDAVPGLFVQTEFFSHDVENSMYHDRFLFAKTPEQIAGPIADEFRLKGEQFLCSGQEKGGFEMGYVKTCNGIVERGLYNDYIACNYCKPWSYPKNGSFNYHFIHVTNGERLL